MAIPVGQRVLAVLFSLGLFAAIVHLIRKGRLREEYALIWLGAGLTILVFSIFGRLVTLLATVFAVSYSPTLILVLGLLFALVIILSQSVTISCQADRVRDLAQAVALLEWHLHKLEERKPGARATRKHELEP